MPLIASCQITAKTVHSLIQTFADCNNNFGFISISDNMIMEAAKIKGKYPVSYANAFAIATAIQNKTIIVTADPEYKAVAKLVKIYWLKVRWSQLNMSSLVPKSSSSFL